MSAGDARGRMLADVKNGLSLPQKELPPTYFYDERGSALFTEITQLPEYYLTRVERALLEQSASRIVRTASPRSLAELGPGSPEKARVLLRAMGANAAMYVPLDVSAPALESIATDLRADFRSLRVEPVVADMRAAFHLPESASRPLLFAFLGSTIGNFTPGDAVALLKRIRAELREHDMLLLGADLVKDVKQLEAAYNDSRGVTAEFNRNVLHAINRELGADFDPVSFRHQAFYNKVLNRIEMHLVSLTPQTVHIPDAGDFTFSEGETIRTEISCKYDRPTVEWMFGQSGFRLAEWFTDDAASFALALGALAG